MRELLFTALGVVLTTIAKLVSDWLESDSNLQTVAAATDEESKSSAALEAWCRAYVAASALTDPAARTLATDFALAVLTKARQRMSQRADAAPATHLGSATLRGVRRALALFRLDQPTKPFGWIPRLLFWIASFVVYRLVADLIGAGKSLMDSLLFMALGVCLTFWFLAGWFPAPRPANHDA
jgi:hypothetical protein